jgi:hypothetical protein
MSFSAAEGDENLSLRTLEVQLQNAVEFSDGLRKVVGSVRAGDNAFGFRAINFYPNHRLYVLVGHSMGGMLTQMQVTAVSRSMWEKEMGDAAKRILPVIPATASW